MRGQVGGKVAPELGYTAAQSACLAVLASLKHAPGDLDRVAAWLVVNRMVNAPPGYPATTAVMNGFSI